jgi:hypothetical protein
MNIVRTEPVPGTTGEVADLIGVCKTTLLGWIRVGYIPEPPFVKIGRVRVRMWGRVDVMCARQHRKYYYYWSRSEVYESEKRAKRIAESGSQCGTRSSEARGA